MGHKEPDNKFEAYFKATGTLITYGCLFIACIVIIGYVLYQLLEGNWAWFKKDGLPFIFVSFLFIIIIYVSFFSFKKDKGKK